jgi:hypothetical protein
VIYNSFIDERNENQMKTTIEILAKATTELKLCKRNKSGSFNGHSLKAPRDRAISELIELGMSRSDACRIVLKVCREVTAL